MRGWTTRMPALRRRLRRRLPLGRQAAEEVVRRGVLLRQPGVARGSRSSRSPEAETSTFGFFFSPASVSGEEARRPDPARAQERLPGLGPAPAGDVLAGEVHDRVDALERRRVDLARVRVPAGLVRAPRRGAREAHDVVAAVVRNGTSALPRRPLAPVIATFMRPRGTPRGRRVLAARAVANPRVRRAPRYRSERTRSGSSAPTAPSRPATPWQDECDTRTVADPGEPSPRRREDAPGESHRMPQFIFTMKDLRKVTPQGKEILKGIWLSFYGDAKIGVLGANGAGKSTLLRIMAGRGQGLRGRGVPGRGHAHRLPAPGAAARPDEERAPARRGGGRGEAEDPPALRGDLGQLLGRHRRRVLAAPGPDRRAEPLGPRQAGRARDGRAAPAPGRRRRHDALGRREAPRRAVPPAAAARRHAPPRRAHEPPRRRVGGLARALPEGLPGLRRRDHPRPLLPRQRGRLDPRARPRRRASPGRATTRPGSSRRTSGSPRRRRKPRPAAGRSSASWSGSASRPARGRPRARPASRGTRSCWPRSRRRRSATTSARSRSRPGRASATSSSTPRACARATATTC